MIWLLLILSIVLNGFCIWYIFNMLKLNSMIFENVRIMKERIVSFNNRVSKIYAMETYYGDETIKTMVEHSKELVDNLDEFLQSMETGENEERE